MKGFTSILDKQKKMYHCTHYQPWLISIDLWRWTSCSHIKALTYNLLTNVTRVCHVEPAPAAADMKRGRHSVQPGSAAWLMAVSSLCKTTKRRMLNVDQMPGCGLSVRACPSSLHHFIVQDLRPVTKFLWMADMTACFKWGIKQLTLWGSLRPFFLHTNQEPAWQFVINFPTIGFADVQSHTHTNTEIMHAKLSMRLFYSSSRRLIWKSKCSTQQRVIASAAEGGQTAGCTALTWPRFILLLCLSH